MPVGNSSVTLGKKYYNCHSLHPMNSALTTTQLNDADLFRRTVDIDDSVKRTGFIGNLFSARSLVFAIQYEMHFRRFSLHHEDNPDPTSNVRRQHVIIKLRVTGVLRMTEHPDAVLRLARTKSRQSAKYASVKQSAVRQHVVAVAENRPVRPRILDSVLLVDAVVRLRDGENPRLVRSHVGEVRQGVLGQVKAGGGAVLGET